MRASEGRHFGYQLTFFRSALSSQEPAPGSSAWRSRQVYLAHFALTDVAGQRHRAFERFSRGALGLAGARTRPFEVWVDDWAAASVGEDTFPLRLRAARDGVALDLTLGQGKAVVLNGDNGLSRKGPTPGNASYYYSFTRMLSHGEMRLGERRFAVRGDSWMDREWSTSALEKDVAGWDWFALRLSDGRDLMFYRLRRRDGAVNPFSRGTLVEPDGRWQPLPRAQVRLTVREHWRSPASGARYPAEWDLAVPEHGINLEVTPRVADQEMDLSVRYWEGAVEVRGQSGGRSVAGDGYLEMTGYGDAAP